MKRAGAEDHVVGRHRLGFVGDNVSHKRQHYDFWVQNPSDQEAEQWAEGSQQGPKCLEDKDMV